MTVRAFGGGLIHTRFEGSKDRLAYAMCCNPGTLWKGDKDWITPGNGDLLPGTVLLDMVARGFYFFEDPGYFSCDGPVDEVHALGATGFGKST